MQKYMTVKYATILLLLISLFTIFHMMVIAPFLNCVIVNESIRTMTHTLSMFVVEPVICILIMVVMINRREEKIYDSIF